MLKKKIKINSLILFALLIFLFAFNNSYSQKIGYIDSKKLLDNMQEAKDAKMKLDNIVQEWQKELTVLQDSLKKMKDDFEKKKLILTDELKQAKEKEISDMEQFINQYNIKKFGENGEYTQKQIELMKPVQNRIFKAIETVAKKEDFDYVFDRSSEILFLYVNEKYDITAKVQKAIEGKY